MQGLVLALATVMIFSGCGKRETAEVEHAKQQADKMAAELHETKRAADVAAAEAHGEMRELKLQNAELQATVSQLRRELAHLQGLADGGQTDDVATGSVVGRITFDGVIPKLPPLVRKGGGIVRDAAVCASTDIPDERLIVGPDGGLANAFVYLPSAPDDYRPQAAPKTPLVFDRNRCRFIPHTLIVRARQTVLIKNSDSIAHNVHTRPLLNRPYNKVISTEERTGSPLVYTVAESVPIRVTSDFHAWMLAWHLPLDHPFAVITGSKGRFEIKNVPVGNHDFQVWHEMAGFLEKRLRVRIVEDGEARVELKFAAERFR